MDTLIHTNTPIHIHMYIYIDILNVHKHTLYTYINITRIHTHTNPYKQTATLHSFDKKTNFALTLNTTNPVLNSNPDPKRSPNLNSSPTIKAWRGPGGYFITLFTVYTSVRFLHHCVTVLGPNQCSTIGITEAVVCAILSVEWCILKKHAANWKE